METSPDDSKALDDELRPEYDFRALRGVVRGKYAERYRERLRVVRLADDVADAFADGGGIQRVAVHPDDGLFFERGDTEVVGESRPALELAEVEK